jgi:predicted permease
MQTLLLILPLIIIAFSGYLSVKLKLFNKAQIDALTHICFTLLLPIFLFNTTYHADLSSQLSLSWFAAFYLPVITVFFLVYLFNKRFYASESAGQRALTATYSNTVLVSIPILYFYLPIEVAGLAFVLIAFHSALLFSVTELLGEGTGIKNLLKATKNPIVLSILSGFAFNLFNIPIPELLFEPLVKLSQSAISLALFGLGASIYFLPVRGNIKLSLILTSAKLFVLPMLVFIFAHYVLYLTDIQTFIAVLLTASPTGVGAYIMAKKNGVGEEVAATTVVISTLICPLTYIFWLSFLPIPS